MKTTTFKNNFKNKIAKKNKRRYNKFGGKMRQDKKLMLGMALLFFITFVCLGTLVVTEKLAPYYTDKIEKRMKAYIDKNYPQEKDNLKIGKISYRAQTYKAKVANRENKNLYFTITYQNKKISDTYKKDYLQGKTLLTATENKLEKKINKKLDIEAKIIFPSTLNKYTKQIRENIIKNNLNDIRIYNIEFTIKNKISISEVNNIVLNIQNTITQLKEINITPNYYTINIENDKQGKILTIKKLTNNTLQPEILTQIITYILTDNENDITEENNILEQYNLSYEYRKYGDE